MMRIVRQALSILCMLWTLYCARSYKFLRKAVAQCSLRLVCGTKIGSSPERGDCRWSWLDNQGSDIGGRIGRGRNNGDMSQREDTVPIRGVCVGLSIVCPLIGIYGPEAATWRQVLGMSYDHLDSDSWDMRAYILRRPAEPRSTQQKLP